jgi:hypothetical protein
MRGLARRVAGARTYLAEEDLREFSGYVPRLTAE